MVRYMKAYTPVVFYLSPPVIYYESYTEIWFDPKNTLYLSQNLKSDEMVFVNTEIGGSKLDFEFLVDYDTHFRYYYDNKAMGQVGEMPIGHSSDIKMLWEVGHAMVSDTEAKHCSYDMKRCYYAMNVPVVFNISSHIGYTSGGQNLTIHGYGFNNENVTVKVGGVDCKVTQYQDSSVSCEVQPTTVPTANATLNQPGANGVRRQYFNGTDIHWSNRDTWANPEQSVATSFEVPTNLKTHSRSGNKMYAWFVAPETSQYRFHMTCNDYCDFWMGLNTSDPLNKTHLVQRRGWTNSRFHLRQLTSDTVSDWVNLTKGENYYVEGRHWDNGWSDNFAVGVEINKTETMDITNHHHAMKEIQYISASPKDSKFETTRITITNPNKGGSYALSLQNPKNLSYSVYKNI